MLGECNQHFGGLGEGKIIVFAVINRVIVEADDAGFYAIVAQIPNQKQFEFGERKGSLHFL